MRVVVVVLASVVLGGCAGSMGSLRDAGPDTAFVHEQASIQYRDHWGTRRIRLDGSHRVDLFPERYMLEDELPGDRFALTDSNTDLLVSIGVGVPREVPELHGRLSEVRFSNDGTKLIASRHADFALPQAQWGDDDSLYLIDAATLRVTVFPARSHEWITSLGWNDAGTEVWTESQNGIREWLELRSGTRRPREQFDAPNKRRDPGKAARIGIMPVIQTCAGKPVTLRADDSGIFLLRSKTSPEQLVHLEGRRRGFHDYLPSFSVAFFSPSCAHVVFAYDKAIWVVDVATKQVGKLATGFDPMLVP